MELDTGELFFMRSSSPGLIEPREDITSDVDPLPNVDSNYIVMENPWSEKILYF